jgi:methyl-accepting chemotaxis protein
VEAARAGDAGRGFAVVAEEVRALALRAAESARQASHLIEENVQAVLDGVSAGDRAVLGITGIETHVASLSEIMAAVGARCAQQLQHVSQISEAVEGLNVITQQSAATAEETAATSEELRSQSDSLNVLMGSFTVRKNQLHRGESQRRAA